MEEGQQKPTLIFKLKRFFVECKRVLRVTRKPDSVEFKTIVKVSGLGMAIVGLIGFVIQIIKQMFFG
ncbi:protein translocase SEC61 complex subunit gamma [Candidatus Woesearchaeota archaeon B3_Woes]|nr:MAG: protein translocase SEC61 complex subunit gamma [Candidatus Woesearchaeota archaeon B3_Woes]